MFDAMPKVTIYQMYGFEGQKGPIMRKRTAVGRIAAVVTSVQFAEE